MGKSLRAAALACTLLCAATTSAAAQDHSDPIPASVGAPGGLEFRINPAAPAGVDAARYVAVVERVMRRWGNVPGSTTAAIPGEIDGVQTVGFGNLRSGVLGTAQYAGLTSSTPVAAWRECVATGETVAGLRLAVSSRTVRLRLRRDTVRRGKVRKRTVTKRVRRVTHRVVGERLPVQRCRSQSGVQRLDTEIEADVVIANAPGEDWALGPAKPTGSQIDFETNLLHEFGHISGLKHQRDGCDPSTPMAVSQSYGDWWHATDDWSRTSCSTTQPPPATSGGDPVDAIGPGLGGRPIWVNPVVPAGYDAQRFVAVARRTIARAGATYAGTTAAPPVPGDGRSTLGFRTMNPGTYSEWQGGEIAVTREEPAAGRCTPTRARVRQSYAVKRTRRVGGRRLRADRLVVRSVQIASARCAAGAPVVRAESPETEHDISLNDRAHAWEFGPAHPRVGTRFDLEGAIVESLVQIAGVPQADSCDGANPNTFLTPGDWWRSPADFRRGGCPEPGTLRTSPRALHVNRSAPERVVSSAGGLRVVVVTDHADEG